MGLKFKLIIKYGSGYEKFECLDCHNKIVIPADRKCRKIWCNVCDNTEKRPCNCKCIK
ncbi:hypothetical protein LCGC14_2812330 [marine sediment metagenome]|uniref:Uncharacterized protein n=1 Tax=marine sediment metagenome TaxID=412755 RepID=A0A0F8YJH9_9ZZZZ